MEPYSFCQVCLCLILYHYTTNNGIAIQHKLAIIVTGLSSSSIHLLLYLGMCSYNYPCGSCSQCYIHNSKCKLNSTALAKLCFIAILCMYIHRTKLTESNEKATDEGLLVMERTRCMSIILFFSSYIRSYEYKKQQLYMYYKRLVCVKIKFLSIQLRSMQCQKQESEIGRLFFENRIFFISY